MLSTWGGPREIGMYMTFYFSKKQLFTTKHGNGFMIYCHQNLENLAQIQSALLTQDLDITFAMSLAIGTFDSYVKALDKQHALDRLLHGHIFATETRILGSWKRFVLSCAENGACVQVCLSYHEFGALFVLLYADRLTKQTINRLWRTDEGCSTGSASGLCVLQHKGCLLPVSGCLVKERFGCLKLSVFEGSKHVSRKRPHRSRKEKGPYQLDISPITKGMQQVPTSGVTGVTEACYKDLPLGIKIFAPWRQVFKAHALKANLEIHWNMLYRIQSIEILIHLCWKHCRVYWVLTDLPGCHPFALQCVAATGFCP